jgi:hypothetical protein
MELLSRGSRELNRLEKRHGLAPRHLAVEHWIAKARHCFVENLHLEKARHCFVENLHLEKARSPLERNAGRPDPNVKVQLDPMVAGHRDLQCAQRCQTGVGRDADPRQTKWDGCHWPMPVERAA